MAIKFIEMFQGSSPEAPPCLFFYSSSCFIFFPVAAPDTPELSQGTFSTFFEREDPNRSVLGCLRTRPVDDLEMNMGFEKINHISD